MTSLKLTLLAAAAISAVSVGAASAMPFNKMSSAALGENYVQNVRVVCNHNGRCYNTHRSYRTYRYAPGYDSYAYGPGYNSYAYGPNNGYYGQPAYGYYGAPRVGIGLGPFGFVGF